jgi:hypothetical protein
MPTPARACIMAAVPAILTMTAPAADIHVPADHPTIQAAVDAAGHGDSIIVADGTYSGPGFVDVDAAGKSVKIESAGGASACTIDGASSPGSNAFHYSSAESSLSTIVGFTFANFRTNAGDEGAIRVENGVGTNILDNVFVNCSTAGPGQPTTPGSAIAMVDSTPVVQRCDFLGNTGSAVHNVNSVVYLIDCLFEGNVTRPTDGRGGGAVLNEGFTLTFDSLYKDNRVEAMGGGAAHGGAFAHLGSMADLTAATFDGNAVVGPSGAQRGAAAYLAGAFVMNGNIVRGHLGNHDGGAVHVEGFAKTPMESFSTAIWEENAVGALRVNDPTGFSDVRVSSSQFCGNNGFDIDGPYVAGGANSVCCPADFDDSAVVDALDFLTLIAAWGTCNGACLPDMNEDGVVDALDFLALIAAWGTCPELPPATD